MKKLFLLLVFQITSILLFAQAGKSIFSTGKSIFVISTGPCFPTGTFSDDGVGISNAGCAQIGLNVNGYVRYSVIKNLAFELKGFFNSNKINTGSFADKMNSVYGRDVASGNLYWNMKGILAGVCASIETGPKGSWDFRILAGPSGLYMPTSRLPASYQRVEKIETHRSNTRMVALNLGTGFTSTISKRLKIISSVEYLGSRTTFKEVYYIVGPFVQGQPREYTPVSNSVTFFYRVINATIGLGYTF